MSRVPAGSVLSYGGFPRVSGDEPDSWLGNIDTLAFSPRERG